jgi:hypothetical protein
MHESQRVYGDKLVDEKDIEAYSKIQVDIVKKNFEVSIYKVYPYRKSFYVRKHPHYNGMNFWTYISWN